jgi:hypothetical protein
MAEQMIAPGGDYGRGLNGNQRHLAEEWDKDPGRLQIRR